MFPCYSFCSLLPSSPLPNRSHGAVVAHVMQVKCDLCHFWVRKVQRMWDSLIFFPSEAARGAWSHTSASQVPGGLVQQNFPPAAIRRMVWVRSKLVEPLDLVNCFHNNRTQWPVLMNTGAQLTILRKLLSPSLLLDSGPLVQGCQFWSYRTGEVNQVKTQVGGSTCIWMNRKLLISSHCLLS